MELASVFANVVTQWVWPIVQFLIGLGAVVFFHELGHFLLAKRVGIRVERFALGFGPRLFGIKRGETDYCICAFPLGGYVGMAGQEDFKPTDLTSDPRAFYNKSVGARLLVISAGVVMNVVLAGLIFVAVGLAGKDFQAPVVGGVVEGFPAAAAEVTWQDAPEGQDETTTGLAGGDKVVKIEGDSVLLKLIDYNISTFGDVMMTGILADKDETYKFTIQRLIDGRRVTGTAEIGVKTDATASAPAFGILSPTDAVLGEASSIVDTPFEPGDRILAIDGRTIEGGWQLDELPVELNGGPVTLTVERNQEQLDIQLRPTLHGGKGQDVIWQDGKRWYGRIISWDDEQIILEAEDGSEKTFEPQRAAVGKAEMLDILGMIPRMKVAAVLKKTAAQKAGLAPGDVIVGYGDRGAPTHRQLFDISEQAVGIGTNIVVRRGDGQLHSAQIVPTKRKGKALIGIEPGVDLAAPIVAGVRPDSPAAEAGITAGMAIEAVNDRQVESWIDLYHALEAETDKPVVLTCRIGTQQRTFDLGTLTGELFDPADYRFALRLGLPRKLLLVQIKKQNPLAAIAWGGRETLRMILSTYVSLRSLILRNVGTEALSGPVGIGRYAIEASRNGLVDFLYFMGFISAAIAVFNFLPLPVLDGGHALFLIIEKIRGRPLPMKLMNAIQMTGLVLIILLFVAITAQDFLKMLG